MFGYIRIFKPHLRICEYDTYKSIYCGLCKNLGKNYGFLFRFTLSYDFTFLAMLELSMNNSEMKIEKERCIAHPLKKTLCAHCTGNFEYTSSAAVLSLYHKLVDDKNDKELKKKIISTLMLPFVKGAYKKATKKYPELSKIIEEEMRNQSQLEQENCKSIDRAAEPTSKIMSAIAKYISDDKTKQEDLQRLGYFLGRYVYLSDAIEDMNKDLRNNNYNVLVYHLNKDADEQQRRKEILELTEDTINLTLGEIAECYVNLNLQKYKDIFDNIIYLGLRNTFLLIIKNEFSKEKK